MHPATPPSAIPWILLSIPLQLTVWPQYSGVIYQSSSQNSREPYPALDPTLIRRLFCRSGRPAWSSHKRAPGVCSNSSWSQIKHFASFKTFISFPNSFSHDTGLVLYFLVKSTASTSSGLTAIITIITLSAYALVKNPASLSNLSSLSVTRHHIVGGRIPPVDISYQPRPLVCAASILPPPSCLPAGAASTLPLCREPRAP